MPPRIGTKKKKSNGPPTAASRQSTRQKRALVRFEPQNNLPRERQNPDPDPEPLDNGPPQQQPLPPPPPPPPPDHPRVPGHNQADLPNDHIPNEAARIDAFRRNLPDDLVQALMEGRVPDPPQRKPFFQTPLQALL